jgi:branched-chain amino acid transport system substrate-binding protein
MPRVEKTAPYEDHRQPRGRLKDALTESVAVSWLKRRPAVPNVIPMQRIRRTVTRHRIAALAVVTMSALTTAACASSSGAQAPTAAAPLTVGVSLSLTGDFADSGRAALRGYQLWADTVDATGGILGRHVQLKVLDDASQPDGAVRNYRQLIARDKVDVVFGPFSTLLTAPSALVAQRYGYAFIEPAGGGPSVFAEKLHNLFFVQQASAIRQGAVFADYILSLPRGQRPKTAAYAMLDDPFAAPIANYIRKRFQAAGIRTVARFTYGAETTNLEPIMSKVAAAKPDVIVSGTQSDDAYAQVNALVKLKFRPKWLFMSNGANSPTEFPDKVGADHVNAILSSDDWLPTATSAANADFVRTYTAKYGGTADAIDSTSAEAFSAGMLLQEVAGKTGKVDNATIIRALHAGSWPTLVGDLRWNAVGEPQGSYTLVQWIDGQLTSVFPSDRAQHAVITPKGPARR